MDRKTNDEFVRGLMMFSRRGALIHFFVIQALHQYSKAVVTDHEGGGLAQKMEGDAFVSPEAWADCAKEVIEKIEEQYVCRS